MADNVNFISIAFHQVHDKMLMIEIHHTRHLCRFEDVNGQNRSKNKNYEGMSFSTKTKPTEIS